MDSFTYTGTEDNLYDLLVWWGTREPFIHSDNCDGESLHCCQGENNFWTPTAVLEASARPTKHGDPFPLTFLYIGDGERIDMIPGDVVCYFGMNRYMLLRKYE